MHYPRNDAQPELNSSSNIPQFGFHSGNQASNINENVDIEDLIADLDQLQLSLSTQMHGTAEDYISAKLDEESNSVNDVCCHVSELSKNGDCREQNAKTFKNSLTTKQKHVSTEVTYNMIPIFSRTGEKLEILEANETMIVSEACRRLEIMLELEYDFNNVIIEQLLDLGIERILEDHVIISNVFSRWAKNANNKLIYITDYIQKYDFFQNTSHYFPIHMLDSETFDKAVTEKAAVKKRALLEELFSSCSNVPALEGYLHTKDFCKKSWTKRFFVLRGSGLYFTSKKKSKVTKASTELECSINFDNCDLYTCYDPATFKKKHKSPTEHCFCLVPLSAKELKEIKCFSSEDANTMNSWIMGIRLAKYGRTLRENYDKALRRKVKLTKLQKNSSHAESVDQD